MKYLVGTEVILALIAWRIMRNQQEELREARGVFMGLILSTIIWIGGVILWELLS